MSSRSRLIAEHFAHLARHRRRRKRGGDKGAQQEACNRVWIVGNWGWGLHSSYKESKNL